MTDYCEFWNEKRFKINIGRLTISDLWAPAEGRKEEADKHYQKLQEITDNINKNDYIMFMGDLNARIGI